MKNADAERLNPCLREQELSFKCFNENNFDKEACEKEMKNYNMCKSFWVSSCLIMYIATRFSDNYANESI